MNLRIFKKLMEESRPMQEYREWQTFLEICSTYLKTHRIKNPVVVEIGMWEGAQKKFYEELFNAEYIGIDLSNARSTPDILGDSQNLDTLKKLKRKLKGRRIDILYIDGSHVYEAVKRDFELYAPLSDGIVAFHDIETFRNTGRKSAQVWKFWDELKSAACRG
ncbi:class I SAM-dependent methyltransferase, partial [bacterium]|nr:class I SAM-dependent methyltransferase [bacterium]